MLSKPGTRFYSNTAQVLATDPPTHETTTVHRRPIIREPEVLRSPRATHAILHARIRAGTYFDAGDIATNTIDKGGRIRETTLEVLIRSLCNDTSSAVVEDRKMAYRMPRLRPSNFLHAGTRAAYELLRLASYNQHPLTYSMYHAVVASCMSRGELLNSALVFARLVRNWGVYLVMKNWPPPDSDTLPSPSEEGSTVAEYMSLKVLVQPPYPKVEMLSYIVSGINSKLSRIPLETDEGLQESLQALAVLISVVTEGGIHFGKLAPIFKAIYRTPKTGRHVWVMKQGKLVHLHAHKYFHQFLMRIINKVLYPDKDTMALPPLDTRAYNTLLYYILNHKHSTALASQILEHMCAQSGRALQPTIETFNILTRAGIVLGKLDISSAALGALQRARQNTDGGPILSLPTEAVASPSAPEHPRTTETMRNSPHAGADPLALQIASLTSDRPLTVDAHTVNNFVRLLTSAGKPEVVADTLMHALPELASIDHPASDRLRAQTRGDMLRQSRRIGLTRAASLGPHFYATVLDTLHKARRTGLAERFWLLATQAARASALRGFAPGVEPWTLSVHAYTAMLQCYLYDASRVRPPRLDPADDPAWVPKTDTHLRGWARFVYQRRQMQLAQGGARRLTPADTALLRFRSSLSGGEAVYWALQEARRAPDLRAPPHPDKLFFAIALRLFTLRPATWSRSRADGHAHSTAMRWTPMAQTVAEAMVSAGHPVPAEFRDVFKDRREPRTRAVATPSTLGR